MKGIVKFFNSEKKFGFITADGGVEVFFHESEIKTPEKIQKGDTVTFETVNGKKGLNAKNINK